MSIELNLETYLCDYVKELIDSVKSLDETNGLNDTLIWCKPSILDTGYISSICMKYNEDTSIDYFNSSKNLSKHLFTICKHFLARKEDEFNALFPFISKFVIDTDELELLRTCFVESIETVNDQNSMQHQIKVYVSLLNIFTVFEHNLRQLIVTIARRNDLDLMNMFLLRDLISNNCLEAILSSGLIKLIKVFIGSPLALNLRNLIWHGFLLPSECSHYYEYFFLLILNKIGFEIDDSFKINRLEAKKLEFINDYKNYVGDTENFKEYLLSINESFLLNEQQKCLVIYTIKELFLQKKCYTQVIMVSLPLIEFLLRKLYIIVNELDFKFNLSAQEKFFYLTMDEILQEFVMISNDEAKIMMKKLMETNEGTEATSNVINKLRLKLGDEFMILLYDMFMFNDGPRIRDRFSHGEYELTQRRIFEIGEINCFEVYGSLCIHIIAYLANCFTSKAVNVNIFADYKCIYHPLALIKFDLVKLIEFLKSKLTSLKPDPILKPEENCLKFIESLIGNEINEMKSFDNLIHYLNAQSINSKFLYLYSSSKMKGTNSSLQVINLMKQLIKECFVFLETIYSYNEATKLKNENKELRTRQRETYKYFKDNSLKMFEACLIDTVFILTSLYSVLIDNKNGIIKNKIDWYVKILRKLLTIFQNLAQQSKINRWLECTQLINELYKIFAISNLL